MPELDDKLRRSDHDTLIRLESKVDSMVNDIKDLKDGTQLRLLDLEARVRIIEKTHDEVRPKEAVEKLDILWTWRNEIMANWKFILAGLGVFAGVLGFLLNAASTYFKLK